MRPLIQLWLLLWAVYVVTGAAVSGLGFRHLDLSFAALVAAVAIPLAQAAAVRAPSWLRGTSGRPAIDRPRVAPAAVAVLAIGLVAVQALWLTRPTAVGPPVTAAVLGYLLPLTLILAAAGVLVEAAVATEPGVMTRLAGAGAVAVPALVAAAAVVADPLAWLVRTLALPPLTPTALAATLVAVAVGGLLATAGRLRPQPVAGRLADAALGAAAAAGAVALLDVHGGGQLDSFWPDLAATALLLAAVLLLAAALQARGKPAGRPARERGLAWWTAPATRLGLLALLVATYLAAWFALRHSVGLDPGLPGEWATRAVVIPPVQAAVLILLVRRSA